MVGIRQLRGDMLVEAGGKDTLQQLARTTGQTTCQHELLEEATNAILLKWGRVPHIVQHGTSLALCRIEDRCLGLAYWYLVGHEACGILNRCWRHWTLRLLLLNSSMGTPISMLVIPRLWITIDVPISLVVQPTTPMLVAIPVMPADT
ncbi:uncharacterized protein G2W53_000767 [Senna tora]|uniref:Uncharacterized protein n=1 Tax=Senna tora TaxID=362788 RepID=A0A834XGH4_9FABA|nr:uncharacterized protein G2W53_000767 [Senna tora]